LGCRSEYYISDISRTYPVNGKFSPRQKAVYEAVLRVNQACIRFLKPGITWVEYNQYASSLLIAELKTLGLITEDQELIKYYWHSVGHMIGLDTHDPTLRSIPFAPGMVMTVEPGLYLEEEGIGVRIEDDVLITEDGAMNLSADIIKDVVDIEAFMKEE
ncbi:MAG: M24 family metallopeptidase, partial [Bacilli bacterium]